MDTTKSTQTWKFTQSQFQWLVDIIENKTPYTNSWEIRSKASQLLREIGWKGWYDMKGKVDLMGLREMYVEDYKQKKALGVDDLPF